MIFNRRRALVGETMLIISERINGLFTTVGKAIDARDSKFIQDLAVRQVEHGAQVLDVNVGPGRDDAPAAMDWLVRTVQDAVAVPLCIDTSGPKTMESGLKAARDKVIMNSTTAEGRKMDLFFPLCREYDAEIICLCMDEKGVPNSADARAEMAMLMMTRAMELDVMPERLLLDPLVLPVSAAQDQGRKVIQAVQAFQSLNEPAPRTVVGLSNVSNGTKQRSLINRTFLAMLMGAGLSAAILDPEDEELMKVLKTGQVLLNEQLYCDDFLRA